jgi:hypothetical protein
MAALVAAPWIIRNVQVMGVPLTPNLGRMFYFVEFNDHFAYGREFNLQTLLAADAAHWQAALWWPPA